MKFSTKLLVTASVLGMSVPAFAQTLTSVVMNTTTLNRSWNTRGGDSNPASFNLYLSLDNGTTFINTGNAAGASINIPLVDGDNTFFFFGTLNIDTVLAMNFGIDGTDASAPTISAVTNANTAATAFTAYSGAAYTNDLTATTGSGSLTSGLYGQKAVKLTAFSYQTTPTRNLVNLYQTGADGFNDTYGSFTLRFAQVAPEPGTLALLGLGMVAGLAIRRRK
jgi:PEP-CTERM motif